MCSAYMLSTQCAMPEEGVGSPGTGVIESCELPCGSWKVNPSPLEQPVH